MHCVSSFLQIATHKSPSIGHNEVETFAWRAANSLGRRPDQRDMRARTLLGSSCIRGQHEIWRARTLDSAVRALHFPTG